MIINTSITLSCIAFKVHGDYNDLMSCLTFVIRIV